MKKNKPDVHQSRSGDQTGSSRASGNGSVRAWTPGPWRTGPINYAAIYSNRTGDLVALAIKDTEETIANAQLIAHAPELYEALDALWEAVRRYDRIGHEGSELLEVMSDTRAVLAKANPSPLGGSPASDRKSDPEAT